MGQTKSYVGAAVFYDRLGEDDFNEVENDRAGTIEGSGPPSEGMNRPQPHREAGRRSALQPLFQSLLRIGKPR